MFQKIRAEPIDTRYRMEVIGHYNQTATDVFRDKDDRVVMVEPGMYPVVASVSLNGERINEGGVIFEGIDTTTAEDRTLVQFYSAKALRDLALSGTLKLEDKIDPNIFDDRALLVTPIETRRQAIRR